jgi:ppGpp synthetase/RelA/SpoT-type nucleotidyltranferase
MNELELIAKWEHERPQYAAWGAYVTTSVLNNLSVLLGDRMLTDVIKIEPKPRLKDTSSFVDKAFHRKKYDNPYDDVEDKVGVRFVVLLTSDVRLIGQAIEQCDFAVSKDKDYEADRARLPLEFSYQSDHFIVRPKMDIVKCPWTFAAGMPCEIQVRTLLQHAHSELTHDRVYKGVREAPPKVKRKVARSMALIEATDDFFEQVVADLDELDRPTRDLFKALNVIYQQRIGSITELARSNVLIIEALVELLGDAIPMQTTELLTEKPFIGPRILERATTQHLFRQPAILLAYLGAHKAPSGTKRYWPLTREELAPIFADLGKALDQF